MKKTPLAIDAPIFDIIDVQESEKGLLSPKLVRFIKYISVVLFVHLIILALMFILITNQDYRAFVAAVLIISSLNFVMKYKDNPKAGDDRELYKVQQSYLND